MTTTEHDDLYGILGVPKDASPQDIKKAFRNLARECHPDVAGNDPEKIERFKRIRAAYELLSDPAQRARYDRRGERRSSPFTGKHWGGFNPANNPPPGGEPHRTAYGGNDLDLEDIFNDFSADFGFGGGKRPSAGPRPRAENPQPGRDITIQVDVPADVVRRGGTITVQYQRLRRADDGQSLIRFEELHDLKIPPGVAHGSTLRVPNQGDAGLNGGAYGDLVCDIRVIADPARAHSSRMRMPREEAPRASGAPHAAGPPDSEEVIIVPIGVAEAILGGRVMVHTPGGAVRISVPPGTSSGTRLRLRGKGVRGPDGQPGDLLAEVRITVPRSIDDESRRLIERFAELNPMAEDE